MGHARTINPDVEVAARAKACLILLPLHDGEETRNSWKPILNQVEAFTAETVRT